jgi:prepilin-type N-terminal cleavage/methylation domain-containing protein
MTNNHPTRRSSWSERAGFSLLELMIVLVVLAMLMAITWPSLRRPLSRGLVHDAARQLSKDLSRARMLAIDSGSTLALRFEVDGFRYQVVPAEQILTAEADETVGFDVGDSDDLLSGDEDSTMDADDSGSFDDLGAFGDDTEAVPVQDSLSGGTDSFARQPLEPTPWSSELPNEVVFGDPAEQRQEEDSFSELYGDELNSEETEPVETLLEQAEDELSGANWSEPVLFYPTGRSDQAEFLLRDPDGYTVIVTLRGVTGAVTIGRVEIPSEDLDEILDSGQESATDSEFEKSDMGPEPMPPATSSEVTRDF